MKILGKNKRGGDNIKIKDIVNNLTDIDNMTKEKLQQTHPKQWLNEIIKIPVWEIRYSYTTIRNNHKTYYKYLIASEIEWEVVENEFNYWLEDFNNSNPERKLSNVEILDTKFLGEFSLEVE